MPTARMSAPYLAENQSGAAVTHNLALDTIDAAAAVLAAANTFSATNTFSGRVDFTQVAPGTADRGVVNLGSGGFAGGGSGNFAGNASGTALAINAPSGFAGDLVMAQVNGAQFFRVGSGGACEAVSFRQSGGSRGLAGGWAWKVVTITPSADADYTVLSADYDAPLMTLVAGSWASGHNVILPATTGGMWWVSNVSGFAAVFKTAAGTGITVATARAATLVCIGGNIVRRTADVDPTV